MRRMRTRNDGVLPVLVESLAYENGAPKDRGVGRVGWVGERKKGGVQLTGLASAWLPGIHASSPSMWFHMGLLTWWLARAWALTSADTRGRVGGLGGLSWCFGLCGGQHKGDRVGADTNICLGGGRGGRRGGEGEGDEDELEGTEAKREMGGGGKGWARCVWK